MTLRRFVPISILALLCTAASASIGAQSAPPAQLPAPPDVAAAPRDASVTASGLASKVISPGRGGAKPVAASTVKVHYSGWTTDGQMFDSSVTRGATSSFPLRGVIRGWTEGLQLMEKGEKRRFWIPAALAYGETPRAGAPKGLLVFDVELFEFTTPVDAAGQLAAYETHKTMTAASPYAAIPWQSIGPSNHTGRMTSIAVADVPGQRNIYVGAATGGVWKSADGGRAWKPIFEHEATSSIGDVAVAPSNPNIVWVGTGEDNLFRASMSGTGIYKSTDAGKTWTHMGLTDSGTIGRIIIDPKNTDVVYVAASGHEWTTNDMRGVFKTTDGGQTWTKSFYRSPSTGAVDLVMDPRDSKTLYAGMWQRTRRKWSDPRVEANYTEGGIWKTTDAGATWTSSSNGLPEPRFRGRVGLDISRSNPNILYAVVDSYDVGRSADLGERDAYGRPLPDNSNIIKGMEIYRSDDKGATWKKTSGLTKDTANKMMSMGNTYNWVFTQIRVDTKNPNRVYVLALEVSVSDDAGATFKSFAAGGGDNHRMWIDPANPKIVYTASDQGFTMTDDGGKTKREATGIHGTQFYNVTLDEPLGNAPFYAYGSVQDAGSFRVAIDARKSRAQFAPLKWEGAPGGEGSVHAVDPLNPLIVYSHGFYGNFTRTDVTPRRARDPKAATGIRPPAAAGDPVQRAQWMAPIIVSLFHPDTLYAGFQNVYRSNDRGNSWAKISGDLTDSNPRQMGVNPSAIPYQTITQLAESPRRQGVLYAGTDDGNLHVTMDAGKTWTDIGKNLPLASKKWISRIVPSKYDVSTVYVAQRGREDDDFAPYLWKSTDFGATWASIAGNIPSGSINVVREDPLVKGMLYAGNDVGAYVSKDEGAHWDVLGANLPSVQVSDLQIHPRDHVIVISTYGRGMWVMDAVKVRTAMSTRPINAADPCEDLAARVLPPTVVTRAQTVPAGQFAATPSGLVAPGAPSFKPYNALPAFCRIAATLTPSADSEIKMELWMPAEHWNGKFEAEGNGGWAGSISLQALTGPLSRGYAVATTDTGHSTRDGGFAFGHPEKLIDFAYRAVHEMTVQSKALIRAYYGHAPTTSYWSGCSTGGRQGLKEAQRYPADYDGIVAGAPTNNMTHMLASDLWIAAATLTDPASMIPKEKYPVIHRAALDACDALDGLKDGVIDDPPRCRFDPKVIACNGADGPTCLTGPQVEAARKIYAPLKNPRTGSEIFPGLAVGSELGWAGLAGGPAPMSISTDYYKFVVFKNPAWDYRTFDFDKDVALADALDNGDDNALDPDLGAFVGRGGKLLMYHGWADMAVAPQNSVNYYTSVVNALGGADKTEDSVRLFMAPGMAHCAGGEGPSNFDKLGPLEQWVEQKRAPDRIEAFRLMAGKIDRTRPLCPYPKVAVYSGAGSTDEARNFACALR